MIPGMRKGAFQRVLTIIFILIMIYKFFENFNIDILKIQDEDRLNAVKEFFLISLSLYGVIFLKKIIFLFKVKYETEKCIEELEYFLYTGMIYMTLTIRNYKKFDKEQREILAYILLLLLFGIYFSYVYFYEEKVKEKNKIFSTRKSELKHLNSVLKEKKSVAIFIDANWGKGKTFFLNEFIEKNKENYIFIKIKSSLFKNKEEIRKFIFQELEVILSNYNIYNKNIMKILNKIEFTKIKTFDFLIEKKSLLEEDIENIRKMFNIIENKKIVLILDDIERVPSIKERKEIISLLSEFEEFLEMKKIVLASRKNIGINSNYLDKYVPMKMQLKELDYFEIIEGIVEQKYQKYYKSVINELLSLRPKDEAVDRSKINKIQKNIETPRFINTINDEFYRHSLHLKFDELSEDEKEGAVACIIFSEILKCYEEDYIVRIKEDINMSLNSSNDPLSVKLIKLYLEKRIDLKNKFYNFIKTGEIMLLTTIFIQKIEKILVKYESRQKFLENEYLCCELEDDLNMMINCKEEEKIEKFYENFSEILKLLYENKKIDIFEFLNLVWRSKKITEKIELENIEIELENIKKEKIITEFCKLEGKMWQEYSHLVRCLFSENRNFDINKLSKLSKCKNEMIFTYSKILMNLNESSSFDKINEVFLNKIKEENIDETEKIYNLVKKNLNLLNRIKEKVSLDKCNKINDEIKFKNYENYSIEELKKAKIEIEKMDEGIYFYKDLLKNAQAAEEFLHKKDEV